MNNWTFIGLGGAGTNFINYLHKKEPHWKTRLIKNESVQLDTMKEDTVCLVSGLGGQLSAKMLLSLVRQLRNMGKTVWVVAITPFKFEGLEREKVAKNTIEELKGVNKLFIYSNQNLLYDKNIDTLSMPELFQNANDAIYGAVKSKL